MFDIANYTYDIWCISRTQDVDVGVGRDMFMANVRAGECLYNGDKSRVDYKALKREYDSSTQDEILNAFQEYSDFKKENYAQICKLFAKQDIAGLKRLCGTPIVTPQVTEIKEEEE